jgi:LPXTG-site transpeptidase (sortase) family protein
MVREKCLAYHSCSLTVVRVMMRVVKEGGVCPFLDGQRGMVSLYKKSVAWSVLGAFMLLILRSSHQEASYGIVQHPIKNVQPVSVMPTRTTHPINASSTPVSVGQPVRLIIPAIHLDTAVEAVGLNAGGDMDTPQEHPLDSVGWYNMGPQPGERGSAVIGGHLDRPGGAPAVFWYLNDLRVGDDVMVVSSQGRTLHFRVTHMQVYQPQSAPLQAIFGDMSGKYLNLITCAGYWIPSEHQTAQRLVVYTSLRK